MIHKHLISANPDGQMIYHIYDDVTGETAFYTEMDAQPIIDINKEQKNNESGNWKGDMHHAARIDPVTWARLWQYYGGNPMSPENKPHFFKHFINNRDYRDFRVKSGRL